MNPVDDKKSSLELTLAFLVLRAWLGVRALATGIEKFSGTRLEQVPLLDASGNPDSSGAIVEVHKKYYAFSNYHAIPESLQNRFAQEPLLPGWLSSPFYAVLGALLIASGLMLLLGLCTRLTLFVMGLLYVGLTLGLILINQDSGIAWLAIHCGLIAYALTLTPHNRYTLTRS